MSSAPAFPDKNCGLCPRLKAFRETQKKKFPDWHNAPVESFGPLTAEFLIVGLAPGLRGANRTGRPFTGDWAGDLLYAMIEKFGFSSGKYAQDSNDGLQLHNCRIANAVRCVPPENKPVGAEMAACLPFLHAEIAAMKNLKAILSLGLISHNNVLKVFKQKLSSAKFRHQAHHKITDQLTLFDSYHCSRYNTNTGRLSEKMFEDVFGDIQSHLAES